MKRMTLIAILLFVIGGMAMAESDQEAFSGSLYSSDEAYVEEAVPGTPLEMLEYNLDRAYERVDFYERVARSIIREEKELGSYQEVLSPKKSKNIKARPKAKK